MSTIERRLLELGIVLPAAAAPVASYVPAVTVGNLVYTSGNDCRVDGKLKYEGKIGSELTVEEGKDAAKITVINLLAVLKEHIGNLDRIKKIVKLLVFVNSADGFTDQPMVANGASDLLIEVFGDRGRHARSAIAANELPFNTAIEIEMIVELDAEEG